MAIGRRVYARQGVTFDLEENEPQIYCIAAPIRDASGATVAAFSVSTTAPYLVDGRMEKMTGEVREVGYAISRALGWPGWLSPGRPTKPSLGSDGSSQRLGEVSDRFRRPGFAGSRAAWPRVTRRLLR